MTLLKDVIFSEKRRETPLSELTREEDGSARLFPYFVVAENSIGPGFIPWSHS